MGAGPSTPPLFSAGRYGLSGSCDFLISTNVSLQLLQLGTAGWTGAVLLGKLGGHTQENEARSLPHTVHKVYLKTGQRAKNIKLLEGSIGINLDDL